MSGKIKIKSRDLDELYQMASLYNHWSIESCRMALYEIQRKLKHMKDNIGE